MERLTSRVEGREMRYLVPVIPLVLVVAVSAQAPGPPPLKVDGPLPSFEVASVKRNNTGMTGPMGIQAPPGRLTATNLPLRVLVNIAHQVAPYQIIGLPGWVDTERYDIAAKAPDGATPDQTLLMV